MAIRGSLGEATFADVLQLLALGRKSGCLSVFEGRNFGRVYLQSGRIVHASIVNRRDRLGDLLLKNGLVDEATLSAAVERQKGQHPDRLGQLLIRAGAITSPQLEQYIGIQIEEAIYFLFTWTSGSFHFEADVAPDEGEILLSINPERLLLEGARRVDEWAVIQRKIGGMDVVFAREAAPEAAPDDRTGAELSGEQKRVLSLVDGQRSAREVVDESGLLDFEAMKALFALLRAGLVHPVARKEAGEVDHDRDARVQAHENLGLAFYQTGMLEEAERELVRVLDIDPGRWIARFRIALVQTRRGAYREAARRLMGLIGEGRDAPSVFHNLALCLEAMGRLEHALLTLDEGRRNFADHPPLLLSRGIVLTKLRRPLDACGAFDRYRELVPRTQVPPAAYFAFSILALGGAARPSEALERGRAGLQHYPRHVPLLVAVAVACHGRGEREEAETLFRRALEVDAGALQARRGLAELLFEGGRQEEAGELYREMLASDQGAGVRFRLGCIAFEHGNRLEAVAYWRDALEVDPEHAEARRRLRLVESGTHSVA